MDETLDLIDNTGVSTEHLFESILQSPSLQKSLRELDDPADITTIYVNYWKETTDNHKVLSCSHERTTSTLFP